MTALKALEINTDECKKYVEKITTELNTLKHSHENKETLDGITAALIYSWNKAVEHIDNSDVHVSSEEKTNVINAATNIAECQRVSAELEVKFNELSDAITGLTTRIEAIESQLNGITFSINDGNVRASWNDASSSSE